MPKLLPGSNDITPSNFPPDPDLPPVLPNPNFPKNLPPSGTVVDFLSIQVESKNTLEYEYFTNRNDFVTDAGEIKDISFAQIVDNSSILEEDVVQTNDIHEDNEQSEVINSHEIGNEHLTEELISDQKIPISNEKLEPQNTQDIPAHPEHIDPQHWHELVVGSAISGAKKAASLLSQGHAAIGLPGISSGYRSPKNEWGKKIGDSYLAEELAVFATPWREIKICFDNETKPETKLNIQRDICQTGSLLQEFGAVVKVVTLPGPDKGVDDFIVTQGGESFEKLSAGAISLESWHQNQLDNLRFTIKLKDGTVKTIDQQRGDSTVTDAPELEPNIGVFKKSRAKSSIDPNSQIIDIKVNDSDIIYIDVNPEPAQPTETPVTSSSWAKKENVTLYESNFFRKRLSASENKQIAFAAYTLLKKYGVEAKDEQQQTSGKIYHADAF